MANSLLPASPWLLDGPTGTELERRGYATALPLWTALAPRECPELLASVHRDYVAAGADVITACTFRTSRHALSKAGLAGEAGSLTREAVALARDASCSAPRKVLVAGSIAPLEDCYFPERTPCDATLRRAHECHVQLLAETGVDLLLVETMPTLREAAIAARIAARTGLPLIVSWVVRGGACAWDGTPIDRCVLAVSEAAPLLVAVNCSSVQACNDAVPALARVGHEFGAYANSGAPDGAFGSAPAVLDVDSYAGAVAAWLDAGATFVGGCCGTTPAHIARLRTLIDVRSSTPRPENLP